MKTHDYRSEFDWWSPYENESEYMLRKIREREFDDFWADLRDETRRALSQSLPDLDELLRRFR